MRRAWRSSARRWRRLCSIRWSFLASNVSSAACAMRLPVSVKLRASLSSKNLEACRPCRRSILEIDVAGLLFSKNFSVDGLGGGGRGGDVQRRVESYCHRGQAKFAAAGLVAELQRNVLFAERGVLERSDGHAKNHGVLVDVQRNLGKREFFEFALGIGDFAAVEAGGKRGLEIGGDEVVLRFFAGVDVEARANLHDNGDLKRAAAAGGIERNIDFGFDDVAAGGNLRLGGGRERKAEHEQRRGQTAGWLKVES